MPSDLTDRFGDGGLSVGEREPTVLVLGGEGAKGLASHLDETYDVRVVTDDEDVVKTAERDGIEARKADLTSGSDLAALCDGVAAAVVDAERDRVSLLASQLLRTVCDVPDVAVRLNDPANHELFEGIDVEFLEDRTVLDREVERTLFDEAR